MSTEMSVTRRTWLKTKHVRPLIFIRPVMTLSPGNCKHTLAAITQMLMRILRKESSQSAPADHVAGYAHLPPHRWNLPWLPMKSPGNNKHTLTAITQLWKGKGGPYSITKCIGFRSRSRFFAVGLQVTWVINPAVGCHYFPPGLQLPPQPLRGLLPVLRLGEQRQDGCEQFA